MVTQRSLNLRRRFGPLTGARMYGEGQRQVKARKLGDITHALTDVSTRLDNFLAVARKIIRRRSTSVLESMSILRELRRETYEDLNQLQHEYMVLAAIDWLIRQRHCPETTDWYCHLQQTSAEGEPDLCGKHEGRSIVWAEVTASENPDGVIDTRIREALESLSQKSSRVRKFYFVRTDAMRRRATSFGSRDMCVPRISGMKCRQLCLAE